MGMVGFRSGVIRDEISDNMAIFLLQPIDESESITVQAAELYEAAWMTPASLAEEGQASVMLYEMVNYVLEEGFEAIEDVDPGDIFGYSAYKLFFKK